MELSELNVTFIALLSGVLFKFTVLEWIRRQKQKKFVEVGKVAGIYLYPVKSTQGWSLQSAYCTPLGLQHAGVSDRHFLVQGDGKVITQRHESTMALITTSCQGDVLHFDAPGMNTLKVPKNRSASRSNLVTCRIWDDTVEVVDCGEMANSWFNRYLKRTGVKLLYYAPELPKRDSSMAQKAWPHKAQVGDSTAFASYSAYMIASEDSLAALNSELSTPVTIRNFRPNISVTGCGSFQEEKWSELRIGTVSFRILDNCTRCLQTTVDPDTGIRDEQQEPLKTLKTINSYAAYQNKAVFGVNAALDTMGRINVGDPVYAYTALCFL